MSTDTAAPALPNHGLPVPEVSRIVRALVVLVVLAYPMVYLGMYAGDAEIHLVYGANAAHGGFFEFNRGETSPGVTSPGFMLMIAALFRCLPAFAVPLAVKAIDLLAWYGLCLIVFLLARRVGLTGGWAWSAACVAGLIPGSAYNATIGMENGVFALAVLAWIYFALVTGWFDVAPSTAGLRALRNEGLHGGFLGLAVWLRPEGLVIGALALAHRAFRSVRAGSDPWWTAMRSIAFLTTFVPVTGLLVAFHHAYTGCFLPGSGRARMLMGSLDAFWIGPLAINTRVIGRLAAYFPVTLAWLAGVRLVLKRQVTTDSAQAAAEFFVLLASSFFVLYSTVLGAAHLARYLIFVMPPFVLVSVLGARWSWELPGRLAFVPVRRPGRAAVLVLVTVLGVVFAFETRQRFELGPHDEVLRAMRAPRERGSHSDSLYAALGAPVELPVVVGAQEVQVRYWLDDRFVVRSLDGRTDPLLLEFADRRRFDHVGYIKARNIRFLLELPNYNGDRSAWSLETLEQLAPTEVLTREGLAFSRLPGGEGFFRVERGRPQAP